MEFQSPVKAANGTKRRKRTKKMVSKTYVNEEGYMGMSFIFYIIDACLIFYAMYVVGLQY